MTLQVLIVDDHGVIRAGLHALLDLEPNMKVVGEAENSEKALELVEQYHPDVVLMDISMPGTNGIETTRQICEKHPSIGVLILTVHEDHELLREALRFGARGYILKQVVKSELINAINAVARGELYVQSSMTRALLTKTPTSSNQARSKEVELTVRELEVVSLIAKGYTNSRIGEMLHISVRTVEFHRSNAMDKLGFKSRMELVRYAAEHNI